VKKQQGIVAGFPGSTRSASPSVPASNTPDNSGISALDIVNLMFIVTQLILNEQSIVEFDKRNDTAATKTTGGMDSGFGAFLCHMVVSR
jgi:hypothetical protein